MKAATQYDRSKIFRNAWYLRRAQPSMNFSACLRKAWRNEKQVILLARIEGRTLETAPALEYHPVAMTVPTSIRSISPLSNRACALLRLWASMLSVLPIVIWFFP